MRPLNDFVGQTVSFRHRRVFVQGWVGFPGSQASRADGAKPSHIGSIQTVFRKLKFLR